MKLFLSMALSIMLMASFTACSDSDSTSSVKTTDNRSDTNTEENNTSNEENTNVEADEAVTTEEVITQGPFTAGVYGEIVVTPSWTPSESALFLDVRNDWERIDYRASGSVGGAIYEYREQNGDGSERYINPNFYEDVLALADNPHKEIILICNSASRTATAAKLLADNGFTNVWHIVGGMNSWSQVKPEQTIMSTPL